MYGLPGQLKQASWLIQYNIDYINFHSLNDYNFMNSWSFSENCILIYLLFDAELLSIFKGHYFFTNISCHNVTEYVQIIEVLL